jgi:hypothetical protein
MNTPDPTHSLVQDFYGRVAKASAPASCCAPSCCTPAATPDIALQLGYSASDLDAVGEGANLGLGCGNPQAIAALQPGETCARPRARGAASTASWRRGRSAPRAVSSAWT